MGGTISLQADEATDLAVGTAAEHLVCYELLMMGYRAFLTDQNCPYDVAVDCGGLIRIQVKATRKQRTIPNNIHVPAYMWYVRKVGKHRVKVYGKDDFDILALVALDIGRIAYLSPSEQKLTIHIRPPGAKGGKQFDDYPFLSAIEKLRQNV